MCFTLFLGESGARAAHELWDTRLPKVVTVFFHRMLGKRRLALSWRAVFEAALTKERAFAARIPGYQVFSVSGEARPFLRHSMRLAERVLPSLQLQCCSLGFFVARTSVDWTAGWVGRLRSNARPVISGRG